MSLHDVSADESAVRAVQTMKVVVIVNHILAESVQSVAVVDRVAAVNEVPLNRQTAVSVQYRIAVFHLKCHVVSCIYCRLKINLRVKIEMK